MSDRLDIDALTALLGQPLRGAELEALLTAWRGQVDSLGGMFDDPPTTSIRLDGDRAALTLRDQVVIRVDVRRLEEAVWPSRRFASALHEVSRAAARAHLGAIVDEQPASDTFRLEAPGGEPWRVTLHHPPGHRGGALAGVDVELWRLHEERVEAAVWRPGAVPPAHVEDARAQIAAGVEPLPPAWRAHLPDVERMKALFGLHVEDPRVLGLRDALGLDLAIHEGSGALVSATGVSLSVDDGVIWAALVPRTWGGDLEAGLRIGVATRADVRARFGPPSYEDDSTDTWEEATGTGTLRRLVSYQDDVVYDYALESR